jgi:hypothetical protein
MKQTDHNVCYISNKAYSTIEHELSSTDITIPMLTPHETAQSVN